MLNNNKLINIFNVFYLLVFSNFANAAEAAPQAAGSWIAIVPPLLTIAVALIIKRVIPALFLGIWVGAWVINDFGLIGIWTGLLDTFQVFVANALSNLLKSQRQCPLRSKTRQPLLNERPVVIF